MTVALFMARHLRALAATPKPPEGGGRRGKTPAATLRASQDEDTCGMPLGDAGTCGLPSDHDDGCALRVVCRCSHADVLHDEVGCRIFVCGCRSMRPVTA